MKFEKKLKLYGVEHNAHTNQIFVRFELVCPANDTEEVLKFYTDGCFSNYFTDKQLKNELEVIRQELYTFELSQEIASKNNQKVILTAPIVGTDETIMSITKQDVVDYKNNYFVSDNFIMCAVSSLPFEDIKAMCDKYFIPRLKSNPKVKLLFFNGRRSFGNKDFLVTIPKETFNKSMMVQLIFKSEKNELKNELYSYFEDFYFNDLNGKMAKKLRDESGLSYTNGISYDNYKNTNIHFPFAQTTPDNVEKVAKAMAEVINDVLTNGVTDQDIEDFRTYITKTHEMRSKIKYRSSKELFEDIIYNVNPFTKNFHQKLLALTKEEINKYFQNTYGKSKMILSLSGDLNYFYNYPTQEQYDKAFDEYQFAPYTITDEQNLINYKNKLNELYNQIRKVPSLKEITRIFRKNEKILYDMDQKLSYSLSKYSKPVQKYIMGTPDTKIKHVNFRKKIETKLKENSTKNDEITK